MRHPFGATLGVVHEPGQARVGSPSDPRVRTRASVASWSRSLAVVVGIVHGRVSVQIAPESVKSSASGWRRDERLPAGGLKAPVRSNAGRRGATPPSSVGRRRRWSSRRCVPGSGRTCLGPGKEQHRATARSRGRDTQGSSGIGYRLRLRDAVAWGAGAAPCHVDRIAGAASGPGCVLGMRGHGERARSRPG